MWDSDAAKWAKQLAGNRVNHLDDKIAFNVGILRGKFFFFLSFSQMLCNSFISTKCKLDQILEAVFPRLQVDSMRTAAAEFPSFLGLVTVYTDMFSWLWLMGDFFFKDLCQIQDLDVFISQSEQKLHQYLPATWGKNCCKRYLLLYSFATEDKWSHDVLMTWEFLQMMNVVVRMGVTEIGADAQEETVKVGIDSRHVNQVQSHLYFHIGNLIVTHTVLNYALCTFVFCLVQPLELMKAVVGLEQWTIYSYPSCRCSIANLDWPIRRW